MEEDRHGFLYNLIIQSHKSIVMTESMRWTLDVYHAVAPEDIIVIPHGSLIVPEEKLQLESQKVAFALSPGKGKDKDKDIDKVKPIIIISNGLIHQKKGYEYAIRAMTEIVKDFPNTLYVIQGIPHPTGEGTKEYYEYLQEHVKELHLEDNILFRSDYVNENELLHILSSCDIYINPYTDKTQAVSGTLAMAMGAGLAVVSTPYPYAVEVIEASNGGILVPFFDEKAIASEIKVMLANPDTKMKEYKENARKYAEQQAWQLVGERYVNIINSLRS